MDWGLIGAAALVYFAAEPIGRVTTRIGRIGRQHHERSAYYSAYCASRGGALIGFGYGLYEIASFRSSVADRLLMAALVLPLCALVGWFAPLLLEGWLWGQRMRFEGWVWTKRIVLERLWTSRIQHGHSIRLDDGEPDRSGAPGRPSESDQLHS